MNKRIGAVVNSGDHCSVEEVNVIDGNLTITSIDCDNVVKKKVFRRKKKK